MNTITIEELMKQKPETITVLDVRPADEYRRGTFDGAISMPMKEIPERKEEIPKDKPVYLLCHTGERSMEYVDYLEQNGYVTRPDKRYRSPLTLTEKGQETGRAIAGKIDRLVEAASEGLTPEQRQVMYDALTCISGHLERLAAPRKSQNGETDL